MLMLNIRVTRQMLMKKAGGMEIATAI